MRFVAEPAYVLHARPWRETSLLVELLSESHGRIGLVARGVQAPKRQLLRAALQPLQSLRIDGLLRGELGQLHAAEALDVAPRLRDEAALAGFYLNELVVRLAPRQDPNPALFALYGQTRARLADEADALAWTLRRFERDLLTVLGIGFDFAGDGDGNAIDPAARYAIDPEHGPRRLRGERGGDRDRSVTGHALLSLADDRPPVAADMPGLRRALRDAIAAHLGGRGLKSWELMAEIRRHAPRG